MDKKNIRNLTYKDMQSYCAAKGYPMHRAAQLYAWVYRKNMSAFSGMTDLPKEIIETVSKECALKKLLCEEKKVSRDGTRKFLWKLEDGEYIESVLLKEKNRRTLCLSTQAGCRFRCPFCASGKKGFKRNLDVSEIVGQVLEAQEITKEKVTNIVFMGMGEPLDNYENLEKAIRIINDKNGLGIGARKITVSTCGIVPGIIKLKDLGIQVELSVSLHASNNAMRNELVPANKKYPLEELLAVCRKHYNATGRVITLEYAMIKGKNDSAEDADALVRVAGRLKAKVNLISCNPYTFEPSSPEKVRKFRDRLRSQGCNVTIRKSCGKDILAACGQLAAEHRIQKLEDRGQRED